MVKDSEIRYLHIPKGDFRLKKCGCKEIKSTIMGSDFWTCHIDGYCPKHLKEARKEFDKQHQLLKINKPKKRRKSINIKS